MEKPFYIRVCCRPQAPCFARVYIKLFPDDVFMRVGDEKKIVVACIEDRQGCSYVKGLQIKTEE